ncbi:hypothetical protein C8P66_12950 [Humitalea rosea]|uniref:Probable membrane transporter protein n=1 Tax=Humitalea rosea TaxID=990373 RepID=A0A2W7JVA4_9PROT|nr:sulfite exporter TauE/SafE family protein [Humitalea rosea]PZW39380.1 hypothetical protein C8P66_12950 [Humitalea rosea]
MTYGIAALATGSGGLVGFVLGLIGGGGSILAVPLLMYVVGVSSPHVAIGTSAVAVAVSALGNVIGHARAGNVKWPCALVFAATGVAGAAVGSSVGKQLDGQKLIVLFGVLMVAIAMLMLRPKKSRGDAKVVLTRATAKHLLPRLVGIGFGAGMMSGFFGIGGGFLIVPGLMAATGMPLLFAIGSSLVAVTAFGMTTAANYALSGFVDWPLVGLFIAGGLGGGVFGGKLAGFLAGKKQLLSQVFAAIVAIVGVYVVFKGLAALGMSEP